MCLVQLTMNAMLAHNSQRERGLRVAKLTNSIERAGRTRSRWQQVHAHACRAASVRVDGTSLRSQLRARKNPVRARSFSFRAHYYFGGSGRATGFDWTRFDEMRAERVCARSIRGGGRRGRNEIRVYRIFSSACVTFSITSPRERQIILEGREDFEYILIYKFTLSKLLLNVENT